MTPGVEVTEPAWHRRIRLTVGMVAVTTALFAAGQTITYLALVRSSASPENLAQAERRLLRPGRHADWEWLGQSGQAAGTTVSEWLETVELAGLQRQQFYQTLPEDLFRAHILSPQLRSSQVMTGALRRELWRHFAPRVRKEAEIPAAAVIIARELRVRVTPQSGAGGATLLRSWQSGTAQPVIWEALYVAALRSTGIAARVGATGEAEIWLGSAWQAAPRPLFTTIRSGRPSPSRSAAGSWPICWSSGKISGPVKPKSGPLFSAAARASGYSGNEARSRARAERRERFGRSSQGLKSARKLPAGGKVGEPIRR